jgi:hypothetical protein
MSRTEGKMSDFATASNHTLLAQHEMDELVRIRYVEAGAIPAISLKGLKGLKGLRKGTQTCASADMCAMFTCPSLRLCYCTLLTSRRLARIGRCLHWVPLH